MATQTNKANTVLKEGASLAEGLRLAEGGHSPRGAFCPMWLASVRWFLHKPITILKLPVHPP